MILKQTDELRLNSNDITKFIDGNDIYNSTLVWKLSELTRTTQQLGLGNTRIDIIAYKLKQDLAYSSNLILANNLTQEDLLKIEQKHEINTIDLTDLIE